MTNSVVQEEIVARECRFAIHVPPKESGQPDVHMVKEVLHTKSGKLVPNIRFIKDYKRPYYITKPSKRSYKDKREAEQIENLIVSECTQSDLRNKVAKALGKAWSNEQMRNLVASPYVYGTDISSTSLIKKDYMNKWPDANTPFTVAVFDIETDVVHGTEDILMCSLVMAENNTYKIVTTINQSFVQGLGAVEEMVERATEKYIRKFIGDWKIEASVKICDNSQECVKACIGTAHLWKPDFMAIWKMDFDIPKVISTLEKAGIEPEDVFSDPKVPKPFRICRYKQGMKKKITASGKVMPVNPAAQWHTLFSTSSFYVIDAMCVYKQLRFSEGEESSYKLDHILQKKLGIRKLKFKKADGYTDKAWHQFMQTYYKIEYIVYNRFDCISILMLDEVTKDLAYTLPEFAGVTDFWDFRSQPKRISDALHFFSLDVGLVLGTVYKGDNQDLPEDAIDDDIEGSENDDPDELEELDATPTNTRTGVLSLGGWVITLPAHMMADNGLQCIEEDPNIKTSLYAYVYDSDAVSAYPKTIESLNVSKGTTHAEIIGMDGVDEQTFRMQNLNLMAGRVNGLEYAQTMFGLPKPFELLAAYQATR